MFEVSSILYALFTLFLSIVYMFVVFHLFYNE